MSKPFGERSPWLHGTILFWTLLPMYVLLLLLIINVTEAYLLWLLAGTCWPPLAGTLYRRWWFKTADVGCINVFLGVVLGWILLACAVFMLGGLQFLARFFDGFGVLAAFVFIAPPLVIGWTCYLAGVLSQRLWEKKQKKTDS